ncbi:hypothetical protein [Pacificibacter marinus]|uniref:Uncharacterized protein n=1 Tax=Pacificibacter marinus TaxID=658057 RepID=A0A1Y5SJP2_9RHOB|nr:hypothetical protein [Pacificibacter marinus]SEK59353.1 hypothetical protein SAMN04488032_10458 [Pacificibacter marinus]SLN42403.1 hypothetical protein PAM7971_02019 [Pacificibacter marinus]
MGKSKHQHWHMLREADGLTLTRRLPARFDFAAKTVISGGAALRKGRVATQVRQDMWRALQSLRGFAPVVQLRVVGDDLEITAGGSVSGQFPKLRSIALVSDVLECPERRARWMRSAQRVT